MELSRPPLARTPIVSISAGKITLDPGLGDSHGRSLHQEHELQEIIRDYGRKVVAPPADYASISIVECEATAVPTWAVEADLWTEEEGRSDLTLSMTIAFGPDGPAIKIDNLHVL